MSYSTTLRLAILVLPLAACTYGDRALTGQCPAGETCSAATPRGLHFLGATLAGDWYAHGPAPTVIGGEQAIQLSYDPGDGDVRDLDLPYVASDAERDGVAVLGSAGATVTVRGVGAGDNYVRIADPDGALYDRYLCAGAILDAIELRPVNTQDELGPTVWLPGKLDVAVALRGRAQDGAGEWQPQLLVDTQTALAMVPDAVQTAWDVLHVPFADVGHHAVLVRAGEAGSPQALDLEIVEAADAIDGPPATDPPLQPNRAQGVCFTARNAGRTVADAQWSFTTDNGTVTNLPAGLANANCAWVTAATADDLHLRAAAAGADLTVTLHVAAAARTAPPAAAAERPTAGERAAATP